MTSSGNQGPQSPSLDRRTLLAYAGFGATLLTGAAGSASVATAAGQQTEAGSKPQFKMKKSINLWAFPYPGKMTLRQCLHAASIPPMAQASSGDRSETSNAD